MNLDDIFNNGFEDEMLKNDSFKKKVEECRNLINEKFGDIVFVEEGHKYTIDDNEYIPVSNIIKRYEPYVDWDEKAKTYARKYGRTQEDVQKDWKLNNLKATISGTRTHEFGESYTNVLCGHPELICESNKPQYIKEYNTMVSTYPKEDAIKKFYEDLEPNLHPVGAEFRLSSKYIKDAQKICGTCDLLFYDSKINKFVIGDWKTNKSLIKDYARSHNIMMEKEMSKYYDEPLSHYILQFNIYKRMLESIGVEIGYMILVWLKEDGTYDRIHIDNIDGKNLDNIIKGVD